ncbi:hypothetical protein [Streptomonospora salina]|uniref:Uncharacterized protein n=1 Tax=Streptomonospora salina TaxID=104205 RepID=A0A841E7I9_9ACTN|nr:hypothetical protein [Streptomonospora salina]MBB5998434.1 hypothetical protein [Streptomonospora salina]
MSTIMPHQRAITVTPEHVRALEEGTLGSLLVWYEATNRVKLTRPDDVPGPEGMVIAGIDTPTGIIEQAIDNGDDYSDAYMASNLTDIANDSLADWPRVKALTPAVTDLRTDLSLRSCHLADGPLSCEFKGEYFLTDTYRSAHRPEVILQVTTAFMQTSPTRVRILRANGRTEVMRFHLDLQGPRPGMSSRLITGAIEAALKALPTV